MNHSNFIFNIQDISGSILIRNWFCRNSAIILLFCFSNSNCISQGYILYGYSGNFLVSLTSDGEVDTIGSIPTPNPSVIRSAYDAVHGNYIYKGSYLYRVSIFNASVVDSIAIPAQNFEYSEKDNKIYVINLGYLFSIDSLGKVDTVGIVPSLYGAYQSTFDQQRGHYILSGKDAIHVYKQLYIISAKNASIVDTFRVDMSYLEYSPVDNKIYGLVGNKICAVDSVGNIVTIGTPTMVNAWNSSTFDYDSSRYILDGLDANYLGTKFVLSTKNLAIIDTFNIFWPSRIEYGGVWNEVVVSLATTIPELHGGDGQIDINVAGGYPPYSFDWDNDGSGDFDDTEDLTGLVAGSYKLVVRDAVGVRDKFKVTVEKSNGVDEYADKIEISPNPSHGTFIIKMSGLNNSSIFSITDFYGREINYRAYHQSEIITLDLESSPGIYLLHLEVDGKRIIRKLIKQ